MERMFVMKHLDPDYNQKTTLQAGWLLLEQVTGIEPAY